MKASPRVIAIIIMFVASAIWGATFVTQRVAGEHMGAFTYNGVRFLLGSLSLLPVIFLLERRDKTNTEKPANLKITWVAGVLGGLILFFAANLQQFGIVLSQSPTASSEAGFITGMYIVFVPLLGLFLRRRVSPVVWLSAILAFSGLALITMGPGGFASIQPSDVLLVVGAVFWAVHILLIDRYVARMRPISFVSIQFLICGVLSLAVALIFETITLEGLYGGLWMLLYGGILASGVAYTFQTLGQRYIEPALAAIILSLESLFAAISEAAFLGETMTPQKYLGGAIIFVGIILAQYKRKPKQ